MELLAHSRVGAWPNNTQGPFHFCFPGHGWPLYEPTNPLSSAYACQADQVAKGTDTFQSSNKGHWTLTLLPPLGAGGKALASLRQPCQQPGQDSRHRFKHSWDERCRISVSHRVACWQRVRWLILSPRLFLEKENVSALEREKGSKHKKSYSLYKGVLGISIKYWWNPEWLMIRGNSNWFMLLVVQYHPRTQQGDQRSAVQVPTDACTGNQRKFSRQNCGSAVFYKLLSCMRKSLAS